MHHYALQHPQLIERHMGMLIENLTAAGQHDAVLRNTMRLPEQVNIPDQYHGMLMNNCFQLLESPATAIAVKAFSLGILAGLAKTYPEIIPDINLISSALLPNASPGIKSRIKNIAKHLAKYNLELPDPLNEI